MLRQGLYRIFCCQTCKCKGTAWLLVDAEKRISSLNTDSCGGQLMNKFKFTPQHTHTAWAPMYEYYHAFTWCTFYRCICMVLFKESKGSTFQCSNAAPSRLLPLACGIGDAPAIDRVCWKWGWELFYRTFFAIKQKLHYAQALSLIRYVSALLVVFTLIRVVHTFVGQPA